MNSIVKAFLDSMSERIFSLIGSNIGASATAYHAASQAEQQSFLEDLARRYESEGKEEVAENLRKQVTLLSQADPAANGQDILERVVSNRQNSTPLLAANGEPSESEHSASPARRKRRVKKAASESNRDTE